MKERLKASFSSKKIELCIGLLKVQNGMPRD
jgi:hypothetical protein